jgi:hypothetical protein
MWELQASDFTRNFFVLKAKEKHELPVLASRIMESFLKLAESSEQE